MNTTLNTVNNVLNTVEGLSQRWKKAREASFRTHFESLDESDFFNKINQIPIEKFEEIIKETFLNSKKLGQSYQKNYKIAWERSDFVEHLTKMNSPCLKGRWSEKEKANVLTRKSCEGAKFGSRYCQYWREAIDGLVLGLSDEVGYVRHCSVNSGDSDCVDIFFQDEVIPTDAIWSNQHRWGRLPKDMQSDLQEIEKKFQDLEIDLKFLGLAEKNLFYKLEPKKNLTCGTAGTLYRNRLEKIVSEKFPLVQLKDASPVAVYGEKA